MKLGALISGGKDSLYAMYKAKEEGHKIVCLITIESINKASWMFHTPNTHLTEIQSKSLGIPLIKIKTKGEKETELKDLKEAITQAIEKYNVEGIVCGALYSKYQWERVDKICGDLEINALCPLWHTNQEQLLHDLLKAKFEIIISSIACDGLNKTFLGRKFDEDLIKELVKLNKKIGINVAGEGGEYESFVLDMPLFKKRIKIEKAKIIMESENTGIYNIEKVKLVDKKSQIK